MPVATLLAAVTTAAATPILIGLAGRLGWLDRAEGSEAARKLQQEPVPPVGGAAILLGLAAYEVVRGLPVGGQLDLWSGLLVAFAVGTIDDLRRGGLSPALKLAGQAAAGLALAHPLFLADSGASLASMASVEGWLWVAGAVVAQNALNTYDNADGAATALSALGLAAAGAVAGGAACIGFLPFNLRGNPRGNPQGRSSGARAYLGDAGSHALGILVLATPLAWPILTLPLVDLARVSFERVRAGVGPWVGDRRHLAHRLADRGLSPIRVVLRLTAVAAPSALGASIAHFAPIARVESAPAALLAGCVLSVAAFFVAVRATASVSGRTGEMN